MLTNSKESFEFEFEFEKEDTAKNGDIKFRFGTQAEPIFRLPEAEENDSYDLTPAELLELEDEPADEETLPKGEELELVGFSSVSVSAPLSPEDITGRANLGVTPQSPQPENDEALAPTTDVLGIRAIERGVLALPGGRYSGLLKLEGLDMKLMSYTEKQRAVRRFASLFNAQTGPFSFYATVKPRDMQHYIGHLDRKRSREEKNALLRRQYWIEQDYLDDLNQTHSLTERNYYLALGSTPADLQVKARAGSRSGVTDAHAENSGSKSGFWETLKTNWNAAWSSDPYGTPADTANRNQFGQSSDPVSLIPSALSSALRFRLDSLAERFSSAGVQALSLEQEATLTLLEEYFNSEPGISNQSIISEAKRANTNAGKDGNTETSADPISLSAYRQAKERQSDYREALNRLGSTTFEEQPGYLKLGANCYAGSLWITELPPSVRFGALFEILSFRDITLQLAVHVRPLSQQQAQRKLKSRQQLLFAVKLNDKSEAGDMGRENKLQEMRELRQLLARGDARLFGMGIRVAVKAPTRARMEADLRRVGQRLSELGYGVAYAERNQRRAFLSTVPTGHDWLANEKLIRDRVIHPNLTGEHIACFMPNCIVDAEQKGGILLGISKADGGLVSFNRWLQVNPHSVLIATSGGGKTVSMEIEILREMLNDPRLEVWYIDPQGVLGNLAKMVGGTVLDMGETGNVVINPVDRFIKNGLPENIGQRLKFLYPLLELMLRGGLSSSDRTAIARAVKRMYRHFEEGEDILGVLERNFLNQPLYFALQPYLYDRRVETVTATAVTKDTNVVREGILTKLRRIYAQLTATYKIPSTGLVRGLPQATNPLRPICYLDNRTNRWYYRGEGETYEPNPLADDLGKAAEEALSAKRKIAAQKIFYPAGVIYPDQEWYAALSREFERRIDEEGVFDMLDDIAYESALNDAFVALKRGMPILRDLLPFLAAEGAVNIVAHLEQFVDEDIYGKLFNSFTNVRLDRRFISFNVQALDEDFLRPIRIFQIINFTWGMTQAIRLPRLFIVDEFGLLVQNYEDVARYVRNLFMRGRAFYLSMTAIVQNITSLLDYQAARQCVENAQRVVLLKQQEDAIERLQAHYKLTNGQVDALLSARPGDALIKLNGRWVYAHYAIADEHLAQFDTRPQEQDADFDFGLEDSLGAAKVG